MMAETTYIAEQSLSYQALFNEMRSLTRVPTSTQETIALVAVSASLEQRAGAILLMSTSGNTARLVSKYRPECPILMGTFPLPYLPRSHAQCVHGPLVPSLPWYLSLPLPAAEDRQPGQVAGGCG